MAYCLLDLPPELLAHILKSLPVRSLLKFSRTCRLAHTLANSNLHTVSLAVQPIRSRASEEYCNQKHCVRISNAHTYHYNLLFKFHNALLTSVITRHAYSLHTLDISIWTLTTPIAQAISGLVALRDVSIRLEDDLYVRAVPRTRVAMERKEQNNAWNLIGQNAVWRARLQSLKIQNADMSSKQLAELLKRSHSCKKLWLIGCKFIEKDIWDFLGYEWIGRSSLQNLHIAGCCWPLEQHGLKAISELVGLQVGRSPLYNRSWKC